MKKLDARRLLCPMPVIKTQDAIKEMLPNEELQVTCTDPGALNDIPAWCRINGHEVLSTKEVNDEVILVIKVGEP
jgi:tRNA 2-thiouridine synthesizing protein A